MSFGDFDHSCGDGFYVALVSDSDSFACFAALTGNLTKLYTTGNELSANCNATRQRNCNKKNEPDIKHWQQIAVQIYTIW
jgi:hypothetical protein